MSVAVKRELCQVESLIKDLTTTSFKEEQPTVNDRATKDLRNRDLQLELDLTRTKLELSTQQSSPKMVSATATTTPHGNFVAKSTLKSHQQDPVVQSELKSLMDSLGDPILLGLTAEEQDPAQPLLEPSTSRGKRPLLIPDFISCLPLVLQEDKETVLGTSGDARIVLKTAQDKKLPLDKISFPQWSAANFRIMHTLMSDGSLSSTQDILHYIMYSSKISELAKCYPLPKVMQYDDLYRRMQFSTNCKLGTDSQFISHQTLHRPDPTPTPPRPPPSKKSRPVLKPATGKQVFHDYQRREGCHFVSSCKYDHVCIKLHCLGTHPQWQHQSATAQEPNTKPILNCISSSE